MEIKGIGAKVAFDGNELTVKHRMLGSVSTYTHEILGVDLKEPRGPFTGTLRIRTLSARHKGMMPKDPWAIQFGFKQADEMRALYEQLLQAKR